ARAQASYELATRCFQEAGADYAAIASLSAQADTAWAMGQHRRAASLLQDTLALLQASPMARRNSVGYAFANQSGVLTELGDLQAARHSAAQAVPILRETGYAWIFMDHFALRLALEGRVREAGFLAGFTDAAYESHQAVREPNEARARR